MAGGSSAVANRRYPLIAREAWPYLALIACGAGLVQFLIGGVIAMFLWTFVLLLTVAFRDPPRVVPAEPLAVVSPSHSRVLGVTHTVNPWLQKEMIRARLVMRLWDIYTLHSPVEGKVMERWGPGSNAAMSRNCYAYWIQTDEGDDVMLAITPHMAFMPVVCRLHPGERVGQGQRLGTLHFGALIELYFPASSTMDVTVGDRVQAGASIVGHLIHESAVSTGGWVTA